MSAFLYAQCAAQKGSMLGVPAIVLRTVGREKDRLVEVHRLQMKTN
jgi:hypothetical protein